MLVRTEINLSDKKRLFLAPPVKIIIIFILALCIALLSSKILLALALLSSSVVLFRLKLITIQYFNRIKNLILFLLFMNLLLILTSGGEVFFKIYLKIFTVNVYKNGLSLSLSIFLRGLSIFNIFYLLISTMDIRTVMHSLEYLHLPKNISLIFYLSYRYIHRYLDELDKLKKSMILKGINLRRMNLFVVGKIYANLLIRSYEDTDRIFKSMVLKGFLLSNPDARITFKIRAFDIYILIFTILIIISIVIIDIFGDFFICLV